MEEDLGVLGTQRPVDEDVPDYLDLFIIELAINRHCAQLVYCILHCANHLFMLPIEFEDVGCYVLWLQFQRITLGTHLLNVLSRISQNSANDVIGGFLQTF